jgi:hypothetical protein
MQKAAPLMLISYLIEINAFIPRIILISKIAGSIGEDHIKSPYEKL